MKRRFNAAVALAMTSVLLVGCGNSKATNDNKATKDNTNVAETPSIPSSEDASQSTLDAIYNGELEKNITLHVLENQTAKQQGYFQELLDAFNEKYKDYGIVAVDADADEYSDLSTNGPAGYGPDVLYQANDMLMKYVDGKDIRPIPLEKLECASHLSQSSLAAFTAEVDGATYVMGVPVNVQTPMLYYRKDLLPEDWETTWDDDKNGVPDMIESWNKLYEFSESIIAKGENNYGYMRSLGSPYPNAGFFLSYGAYIFGNHNTDPQDVGLAAGDAKLGGNMLIQLSKIMNKECTDESITSNAYNKMAKGIYFATMTTPDVYGLFIDEMAAEYELQGLSEEEARAKARENIVMTVVPQLPKSGDLTEKNPELFEMTEMGGINGYAISAYSEYPNASLAFVDFATSYDMIQKRYEMLDIVPAREDNAAAASPICKLVYDKLDSGHIDLMPSINTVTQIWTPMQTFFIDLANDGFRDDSEKKYATIDEVQAGLEKTSKEIVDNINAFTSNKAE